MKLRIKSMIWSIRKQKTIDQNNKKKKESKKEDNVSSLWENFKHSKIHIIRMPEEKRKSKKLENYVKSNERKLP